MFIDSPLTSDEYLAVVIARIAIVGANNALLYLAKPLRSQHSIYLSKVSTTIDLKVKELPDHIAKKFKKRALSISCSSTAKAKVKSNAGSIFWAGSQYPPAQNKAVKGQSGFLIATLHQISLCLFLLQSPWQCTGCKAQITKRQ